MAESVTPAITERACQSARVAGAEAGFGPGVHSRTVLTSDGLNAAIEAAYAAGRADERARVVALLRMPHRSRTDYTSPGSRTSSSGVSTLATDSEAFLAEAVRRSRTPFANLKDDGRHVAWHHVCIGERDLVATVWTTVTLPLGPWRVVSADPLTVEPSIQCAACGTHGFITDGEWRDA